MINISTGPIERMNNSKKNKLKKTTKKFEVFSEEDVDLGVFPLLAIHEGDEENKDNEEKELGQFLRGLKDPSEIEVEI
jgi:hypothetical protein